MQLNIPDSKVSVREEKFSKPNYCQIHAPNNYFYYKLTLPKRYLVNHLSNEFTWSMFTYDEGTFTRVRLTQHGVVEEIVLVTKEVFYHMSFYCITCSK